MLKPEPTAIWIGVAVVLAIVVVLLAIAAVRRRGRGRDFEVRPLPADRLEPFATRLDELERKFVTAPREALAETRQTVDEMLALMGYPARLAPGHRARDVASVDRARGRRYHAAAMVDDRATTEEMRRAMQHLLTMGRDMLAEARTSGPAAPVPTPAVEAERAGEERGERRFAG
jgi:hypothetical protein